jgi:H+/Cl- antiporter ClcA
MREGLSIEMAKRYIDLNNDELVDEYYRIENNKSERLYFALGAIIGVFGNLAINTLIELLNITKESQLYTFLTIGSIVLFIVFIFITYDKNSDDNRRKESINKILRGRRSHE